MAEILKIHDFTAEIFRAEGTSPAPVVIVLHAGAWTRRSGTLRGVCKELTKNGFTALNVAYSLAPRHRYPKARDDVKQAVEWVRENASKFQIDSSHVFLWGYSAGGHLALLAGLDPSLGVRAIVAGAALSDLTVLKKSYLIENFLGKKYAQATDLWAEASPIRAAQKNSPPVFLYHGERDLIVPVSQSLSLHEKLKELKVVSECEIVPWLGHIGVYLLSRASVKHGIEFLKRFYTK